VDPHYLSWKMRTLDYRTRFIELASEINAEMPSFVVGKVRQALNTVSKPVRGSRVVILGVAYKKDIDDIRESPALDILRFLRADGANVVFHDPLIPTFHEDGEEWHSEPWSRELLTEADAVVIVTDHTSYDFREILELSPILVDTRNATARIVRELEDAARDSGESMLSEPVFPKRWIVKGA
jgi:UDP-N-acetyl-D-glucosamine dehydrogenase